MPAHTVDTLETKLDTYDVRLAEATVLVLGLTYRPGVNELRYAPAVDTIDLLNEAGSAVVAHDPLLDSETIAELGATPVSEPAAANGVDGIILATGHKQYAGIDLEELSQAVDTPVFVDGRAFFDAEQLSSFDATAIGRADTS
jgi:UDP-N-acetyl-D-mannosaminuronic acid dehydrogenase